jgi:LacI family transcriptional regulator
LSRGLRNFAALIRKTRANELELKAFRQVLGEAGYSCVTNKVPQIVSRNVAQWRKTEQIIAESMDLWQPPTGVFVGAEDVGRIVVQMCRDRGWRVPEDVAIIAGQNEETLCEHPRPSLSSVELGYEHIGYEAARLLDRLMNAPKGAAGKKRPTVDPEHILLPPQALVVRESTDFFAVKDKLVATALEFIAAQSYKSIGPEDVAQAVSTELRTLQRRFHKHLDRPIATEIRRVRIERAKRELTQTDRPIASISRDVGFGEPMRMYEVFVRQLGVTPSEYRKQRQMDNGM